MRRIFPALVLASSSAQAGLPLYNTDLLAAGEAAASWSLYLAKLEAEALYTQPPIPLAGPALPGSTETTTRAGALELLLGLGDRLNGRLFFAFTDEDLDARIRGATAASTPVVVDIRAGQRGEEDLGLGLDYQLSGHAVHPLVARLAVLVPTASDYPGAAGVTIDGTPLTAVNDGGRGTGQTRFLPSLGGSVKTQSGAAEWDLRIETDDEKTTEDRYELVLGWVQRLGAAGFVRIAGSAAWQQGQQTAALSVTDSEDYALALTGGYDLTPTVRVSAIYSLGWLDDVRTTSSGGSVVEQTGRERQAALLGISYMLP